MNEFVLDLLLKLMRDRCSEFLILPYKVKAEFLTELKWNLASLVCVCVCKNVIKFHVDV